MAVDGASRYVGVAYHEAVALSGGQLIEVFFDGILRKTVADGQYLDELGLKRGCAS